MPIQGTGGSMFVELQRNGAYVSDECFKMAITDAISVACKQLGIGADVYWEKDQTKYKEGRRQPEETDEERKRLLEELSRELIRTGYGWNNVRKKYKVETEEKLSKLQIKDCIKGMKSVPDKKVS